MDSGRGVDLWGVGCMVSNLRCGGLEIWDWGNDNVYNKSCGVCFVCGLYD